MVGDTLWIGGCVLQGICLISLVTVRYDQLPCGHLCSPIVVVNSCDDVTTFCIGRTACLQFLGGQ